MLIREISTSVPSEEALPEHPRYCFGSFELRPDGTLLRKSTVITLPPKELAILRRLLADHGKVVTIDALRRAGWGMVHVSQDSLPRCISSLRARLGSELSIATVYKRGYRFEAPVSSEAAPDGLLQERLDLRDLHRRNGNVEIVQGLGGLGSGDQGYRNQDATSASGDAMGLVATRAQVLPKLLIFPFAAGTEVPESLGSEIAEEIVFRLSRAHKGFVDLLASSPVFALANRGLTALEAGISLRADLVLVGKISATPTHFRLRVEMFRVDNGVQLWVEDFLIPRALVSMAEAHMARLIIARIGGTFTTSSAGLQSKLKLDLARRHELRPRNSARSRGGNADCLNRLRASAPLMA